MRYYMIAHRRSQRLTQSAMAKRLNISVRLLRMLEEDETVVTHPNIARRVGAEYGLSEEAILMMMPENYRPGDNYDPGKYVEFESADDIFRAYNTVKPQQQRVESPEKLGEKLRQARKEKGLTMQQLADMSGASLSTISQYERGKRRMSDEFRAKLFGVLGINDEG